ncbi:MAG: hypothetical protein JW742_02395 [Candidatus Aminicenantes bacterium]|nr:hypothetical protein [Candidatus Aminicenantes bacterium]
MREQMERQALLEEMLREYNEGRSMSLYCRLCARMPVESIRASLWKAEEKLAAEKTERSDLISKAGIFKEVLLDSAKAAAVHLD